MKSNRVLSFLTNGTPWLIEQGALETIFEIAQRKTDLEAALKERGEPLDNTHKVEMRGGVAIIPIKGALIPYGNVFSEVSGAYSVEMLMQDLAVAENNPDVRSVILMMHTPGGHTTLINEFANMIAAFPKPIVSYVVGNAASAGYWLASASDRIIVDATAMVGSIGVVMGMQSADKNAIEFVSSHAKDKRPDVSTDAGKAVVQGIVDDMEQVFIESVMNFRGMSREQITALRGGVVIGAKAVEQGFADEVGSLESVILQLNMENPMDLSTLKADYPDVYQAAFNAGAASVDVVAASKQAVTAEHDRISAILNHDEAKGRDAQAKAFAFETDMDAETVGKLLAAAPITAQDANAGGNEFKKHMDAMGNPRVGADSDDQPDTRIEADQKGWSQAFGGLSVMQGGKHS